MKTFRIIIGILNNSLGALLFGTAIRYLYFENYKTAAWMLLVVSAMLAIEHLITEWYA